MDILYEKRGKIGLVTLNRPEQLNAMTFQMLAGLKTVFGEIRKDPDVYVVVVTGAGHKAFCVGQDLNELKKFLEEEDDSLAKSYWDKTGFDSILTDDTINKPVIAAINGHCIGYGLTLALSCDMRIASEPATFGFPEVTIGVPTVIGAIKLPRVVALGPAMELLLVGDTIKADEAYRLGLVNRVVDPSQVLESAMALAEKIAQNNITALKATKEIVIRSLSLPFNEVWRLGEAFRVLSIDKDKIKSRVASFFNKKS